MRLMKESKGAKILINIGLEANKFKHFLGFRKKFKRLHNTLLSCHLAFNAKITISYGINNKNSGHIPCKAPL